MALTELIGELRRDPGFMANVAAWETLPAAPAAFTAWGDLPPLHPDLVVLLQRRGIPRLYSHQAEAVSHALAGRDVVVVTPTASGKTLVYALPALQSWLADPAARTLFLYPTKALAQDQLAALRGWVGDLQPASGARHTVAVYDGDTPSAERPAMRAQARFLLSNPDMLHVGILPYHTQWAEFFANLRTVVVDELHTYRGVFGSHVANVLRRLRRVCAFYGSRPQFVCTSATIGNPQQLAGQMVERPVALVERSGAPTGEKHVILYNPPMVDAQHGLRRSALLETQALAARCVQAGVQSIVFGRSRLTTELLLTYLRDHLLRDEAGGRRAAQARWADEWRGDWSARVRGYRGGYLPTERRAIEAGLRAGTVRAVVATNALELGIDIGQLQAALLCGYPGSIAGTWQQIGRAGRTAETSLAILVATALPIDQYIAQHPEFIFGRTPEHALVNPDNLMLLVDQMRCAAFELPFAEGEGFGASPIAGDVLALLAEQGEAQQAAGRILWAGAPYPARAVSLRSTGIDPVAIQAETPGAPPNVVGQVEEASAPSLVHAGAIYLHEGQTYLVDRLDLEQRVAHVHPYDADFYTTVEGETLVDVLATHAERQAGGALAAHGDVRVSSQVLGYRRVKRFTHETLGHFPLDYPPQVLETAAYWLTVLPATQAALAAAGDWFDSVNDYGPNWQEQRRRVRERDHFRCKQCGAPERGGREHDVHHLVPFRTFGYVAGRNDAYLEANRLDNLILVCRSCHQRIETAVRTRSALDGLGYALHNLAPLYLMCDRGDIGVHTMRAESSTEAVPARITIYEHAAAGLGFSLRLYELHAELLRAARERVAACTCANGCPACVGPVLDQAAQLETKRLTLALAAALLDAPPPARPHLTDVDFW